MKRFSAVCALLALLVPVLALAAGKITEAKLGKTVVDRKVADESSVFAPGERAYLWMKVDDAAGETLTVTWEINGQTYPAELKIGGIIDFHPQVSPFARREDGGFIGDLAIDHVFPQFCFGYLPGSERQRRHQQRKQCTHSGESFHRGSPLI